MANVCLFPFQKQKVLEGWHFALMLWLSALFLHNDTFVTGVTQDYSLPAEHQHLIAYFLFNHVLLAHLGHRAVYYL